MGKKQHQEHECHETIGERFTENFGGPVPRGSCPKVNAFIHGDKDHERRS